MPFRNNRPAQPRPLAPWLTWLIVSTFIAAAEFLLMLFFSWALPKDLPSVAEAVLDALLLTVIVAPVLWWVVVRPLQQAAELRGRFLADLFNTIEGERRRIAHELHDGVGQSLTMLVSGLRSLPGAAEPTELNHRGQALLELAHRALKDTKQLALGLRPSLLDDLGLAAAIERVAEEVREHHPIDVTLDVADLAVQRLPETTETALFRIFQEAISNVVQHSRATQVLVRLRREPHCVVLEVGDNGRGVDINRISWKDRLKGHLGLIGMSERAALLGGVAEMETDPGRGMRIVVRVPEQDA